MGEYQTRLRAPEILSGPIMSSGQNKLAKSSSNISIQSRGSRISGKLSKVSKSQRSLRGDAFQSYSNETGRQRHSHRHRDCCKVKEQILTTKLKVVGVGPVDVSKAAHRFQTKKSVKNIRQAISPNELRDIYKETR